MQRVQYTYADDEIVTNYHDAVITGSDLNLLERRAEWLNGACLHFYFTLLARNQKEKMDQAENEGTLEGLAAVKPTTNVASKDYFIDPIVTSFFMHQCNDEEDAKDLVSCLPFPKVSDGSAERFGRVFIAVSDNMAKGSDYQTPGLGSHWSLLVTRVSLGGVEYYHFDSMKKSGNFVAAQDIAVKLSRYVYPDVKLETKRSNSSSSATNPIVQACATPYQANGYDCGVHVLGAAKIFANIPPETPTEALEQALKQGMGDDPSKYCAALRQEIASAIREVAEPERTATIMSS
ncbi:MAG: hypothetical protein SGILL_009593 [Bacillariaceae sp.]